jgi:hypothetical protein
MVMITSVLDLGIANETHPLKMQFNLQGFIDVLTFQVPWMEANFFWVFVSVVVYFMGIALAWLILALAWGRWQDWVFKQHEAGRSLLVYLIVGIIVFYTIIIILEFNGVKT